MNATVEKMLPPFPWFGGKRKVSGLVWERFGAVKNYVEPFFGSGAVLLGRPPELFGKYETINDFDCFVTNFWRGIKWDPEAVAYWADWRVDEADLTARHIYLVKKAYELRARIMGCPHYFDPELAGFWVWGQSTWIGGEWCSGDGPWTSVDGRLVHTPSTNGVTSGRPHLGRPMGVQKRLVHLSSSQGIHAKRPSCAHPRGFQKEEDLLEYFHKLALRLQKVRICCGDWSRVCGKSVTYYLGKTGVFLDPPYGDVEGDEENEPARRRCYAKDCFEVSKKVQKWCLENGSNPQLRIALCGYSGEHEILKKHGWEVESWKADGGYSNHAKEDNNNKFRERIWWSPNCLRPEKDQLQLFG